MTVGSSLNETRVTTISGPASIVLAVDKLGKTVTNVVSYDRAEPFDKAAWLEGVALLAREASLAEIDPLYITVYVPVGVTIQIVENGNPDVGPPDGFISVGLSAVGFIFDPPRNTEIQIKALVAPPGSTLTIATALIVGGNIVGSGIATVPISV